MLILPKVIDYKNLIWGSVVDGLFQPEEWPCWAWQIDLRCDRIFWLLSPNRRELEKKKYSSSAGFEPATSGLEVQRAIHCATRTCWRRLRYASQVRWLLSILVIEFVKAWIYISWGNLSFDWYTDICSILRADQLRICIVSLAPSLSTLSNPSSFGSHLVLSKDSIQMRRLKIHIYLKIHFLTSTAMEECMVRRMYIYIFFFYVTDRFLRSVELYRTIIILLLIEP